MCVCWCHIKVGTKCPKSGDNVCPMAKSGDSDSQLGSYWRRVCGRMPYKRTYKRKSIKRDKRQYKRVKRTGNALTVGRFSMVSAVPDLMRVRLKFTDNQALTDTATAMGHVYAMNSIFDPRQAGGAAHTLGFDQWMAFYAKYRVISSTITVRAENALGAVGDGMVVTIHPNRNNTLITNVSRIAEQPYATKAIMSPQGGGSDVVTVSNTLAISKFAGLKSIQYGDEWVGQIGTDPDRIFFWHVNFNHTDGISASLIANFQAEIVYDVELFSRVPLPAST